MYDPKPLDMTDALMQVYEKAGCGKGYSAGGAYSKGGEKKLDAVGKEDKDVDNDGDHDKSDKYLLNRRKVRGQAIATRKEEVEELMGSLNEEQLDEVIETIKNFVGLAKNKDHKVSDKTPMGAAVTGLQKRRQATNDAMKLLGRSYGGKVKKEALVFSDAELDFLVTEAHDIIEQLSDEVLINFFEDAIIELAEDQEDLMEMCDELELRGIMLHEASDKYYDDAVKASKEAAKKKKDAEKESMGDRLKRLASKAGENLKKGAKAVVGAGARAAGHAAGEFSAQKEKSKKAAEERNAKKDGEKDGEKKGDGDETGGKLDKVLADIRGRKDSDSDSGGGESSSGGGGESRGKKKPGILKRIGKALKSGLKKAVGRTARVVSSGSDKLASRMGEDFEQIDSLIESGLFTWREIEDIVEGVRDEDPEKGTKERKKRLEKKRGMKLDDHPQYKEEEKEGMHRDAKTGEVVKKAEIGKTYYPNMPKKKTSVAIRKEKEAK